MYSPQHPSRLRSILFAALILVSLTGCARSATPAPAPYPAEPPVYTAIPAQVAELQTTQTPIVVEVTKVPEPTQPPEPSQPPEATEVPTVSSSGSQPFDGVSPTDSLVQGRWVQTGASASNSEGSADSLVFALVFGMRDQLEFLQNGIVVLYAQSLAMIVSATYSFTSDGWMKLGASGGEYAFRCTLVGDKLTFYGGANDSYEYTRVKATPGGIPDPVSVSSLKSSVLGKWELANAADALDTQLQWLFALWEKWEFLQNGIVTVSGSLMGPMSGTYTFPQNGWVNVKLGTDMVAFRLIVSDSEMTWYDGDGKPVGLKRSE